MTILKLFQKFLNIIFNNNVLKFLLDQQVPFYDAESILDKYQVTIYRAKKPVCDGCLINNLYVLSVASCFVSKKSDDYKFKSVDNNKVMVVGGTSDLPSHPSRKFKVQAVLLYLLRNYLESSDNSSVGDIAVLKVRKTYFRNRLFIFRLFGTHFGIFQLKKVLNVFLPEFPNKWLRLPSYDRSQALFDSKFLSISGSRQRDFLLSNEIQTTDKRISFARVELLSRLACTNNFQGEMESKFFETTNSIMCARVVQPDPELFDRMCTVSKIFFTLNLKKSFAKIRI